LFYTILSTLEDEGPIICRMHYSKIEDSKYQYYESQVNKIRDAFNLYKHPNVLVFDKIFNVQKKAMLGVRQFVCHNLKEKLHRVPKLSIMEKKWLVFQLLCAIAQIHSAKMVHGDIKPSNILLTSYNQLFLADMLPFKPAFISGDDLKTYNLYFGEMDNN
jgi:phosphoinositide-3-kinase regulatory subunit 4